MKIEVPKELLFKITPAQRRALELVLRRIRKGPRRGVCVILEGLAYDKGLIKEVTADALCRRIGEIIGRGRYISYSHFNVASEEFYDEQHLYRRAWVKALLKGKSK